MAFYNWGKTHSYTNCLVYFVIGGRTTGKTYGLRKDFVTDYINHGHRFVEICRTASELSDFESDYFGKLEANGEFPGHVFKIEKDRAYIAERPGEGDEPDFQLMGYFLPLSQEQKIKRRTFVGVRNYCLDEAVIDRETSPFARYLPNEWKAILGIVNTCSREVPGSGQPKPRIHLLGNACDLTCPLFSALGIDRVPAPGERALYRGKTVMVHRLEANDAAYREDTAVGRLASGDLARQFFDTEFLEEGSRFLAPVPKGAKHMFNIMFGEEFGVYFDVRRGLTYVGKPRKSSESADYVLAREDMTVDYIMLDQSGPVIKYIKQAYRMGAVRYDTPARMGAFYNLLSCIGLR